MEQEMLKEHSRIENELFKNILEQALGREVSIEDGKSLTIYHQVGNSRQRVVSINGAIVGSVFNYLSYSPDKGYSYNIHFDPDIKTFQNQTT